MRFPGPLKSGKLIKRYKRFLADVLLDDGTTVTASCPNTGSMLGLTTPGATVWLSESDSPTRKYPHTWQLIEHDCGRGPTLVGINTGLPNHIVTTAIANKAIPQLNGYARLRREVKYGSSSRIDILLDDDERGQCYVEIKNVHLARKPGLAEFPDSKTARGVKHLHELTDMVRQGHEAYMLYLVQRQDADAFAIAKDIDPAYGEAFTKARDAGVKAIAYRCAISTEAISLQDEIPITA